MTKTQKLNYAICTLVALVLGVFFLWQGVNKYSEHKRYPTDGIVAEAYPTSDHYTETRRRFGIKSYDTDLAFKTPDGQVIRLDNANISKEELAKLQAGNNIEREYLPEDPKGTARRKGDAMGVWAVFAIGLITLGFAVEWLRKLLRKAPSENLETNLTNESNPKSEP